MDLQPTTHHLSPKYPSQTLFGFPFFNGSTVQAVEYIWQKILDNEFISIATPNPEQVVLAQEQIQFRSVLQDFDVFLPDGQGIVWASKKFGRSLEERITGVDVVKYLVEKLQHASLVGLVVGGRGYDQVISGRLLVGGDKQDNKAAKIYQEKEEKKLGARAEALGLSRENVGEMDARDRFVNLDLMHNSPSATSLFWLRNFELSEHDDKLILDWIEKKHPVVVFVALGAPIQEMWIEKHRKFLKRNGVRCVMAVGGSFDMLIGKVSRAPELLQSARLEWLWRLIQQPWRWRRQLRLIRFIGLVMFR